MASSGIGSEPDECTCRSAVLPSLLGKVNHLKPALAKDLTPFVKLKAQYFKVEEDDERPAFDADSRIEARNDRR